MAVATIKDKLAAGAAEIRKAEAQAADEKPFSEKELKPTRDIKEVMRERVTVLDNHIGLKLSPQTTPAENLQILDHVVQMGDHVQFMIGDVINDGEYRWGKKKYEDALNRTNRARRTLQEYARTSLVIPHNKRIMTLPFSHHAAIAKLNGSPKLDEALGQLAKSKDEVQVADVRSIVKKLAPPKVRKPTSGKSKKKGKVKPAAPPYEPSEEEEAKLDNFMDALEDAEAAGRSIKSVLLKLNNKRKREFEKGLEWLCGLLTEVQKTTGY